MTQLNTFAKIHIIPQSICLVHYKGKYWYYRKDSDTHVSLRDLKDHSADITVIDSEVKSQNLP